MFQNLRRVLVALCATALLVGAFASPVSAKPPRKAGAVTNLAVTVGKTGAVFDVHATWTAGAYATKYAVKLTAAGATVDSGTVATTAWTGQTTVADGSAVTVTVTSYNGSRRGASAWKTINLPDLTAPVASYTVVREAGDPTSGIVTIQRDSLTDNMSALANLTQTIDWGDGTSPQAWPSTQTTITRDLTNALKVYYVRVTVKDQVNNARTYPLTVVVRDTQAPTTGIFTVSAHNAWASWTKVSLTQVDVTDNLSADNKLSRVIAWGDGSETAWPQGSKPTHQYAAAGTYTPSVRLADEAANTSAPFVTGSVVVKLDTTRPTLRLTLPKTGKARVRSWRVLRGSASDAQTGVRGVGLVAIEKRGTVWYAYQAATHKWVKGGATKARAWRKAVAAGVLPRADGTWQLRVYGLTKGTLVYKARAVDNRANVSSWLTHKAVLTRR
jgi:hypothetical protein